VVSASAPTTSTLRAILLTIQLNVSDKKEVNNIDRVIRLRDENRPPAWNSHNEITVMDGNFPTIRQMDDKRFEWFGIIQFFQAFNRHYASSGSAVDDVSSIPLAPSGSKSGEFTKTFASINESWC
jgi:hypothetical protein